MTRSWLLAAAAVGLALRLAFALGYWTGKPLTHDEQEYLALAQNLVAGRGFSYQGADVIAAEDGVAPERFGRAPGYPAFAAAVLWLAGAPTDAPFIETPRSLKVAQSFVGAAGIIVIGLMAWRVAGPRAGEFAAVAAALYPPLVWICAYALSEALYSVVALSSAAVFCLGLGRADRPFDPAGPGWLMFVSGLLGGAAALIRSSMLIFFFLAGLYLCWRRRMTLVALLAAGSLLVVAPWTLRNIQEHGRFVLVASDGGVTFWTGNNPLARGEGDQAANPEIKRANLELRTAHAGLTAEQLEPIYYREAFAFIRDRPLEWAVLLAKKFFYTWIPIGPSYTLHSQRYYLTSLASYGLVLPFAIAGAWLLMARGTSPRGLWLLAASAVLVCVIFFPQERFRLPVIDPVLLVCAASWLALRRGGGLQNRRAWT